MKGQCIRHILQCWNTSFCQSAPCPPSAPLKRGKHWEQRSCPPQRWDSREHPITPCSQKQGDKDLGSNRGAGELPQTQTPPGAPNVPKRFVCSLKILWQTKGAPKHTSPYKQLFSKAAACKKVSSLGAEFWKLLSTLTSWKEKIN